MAKSSQTFRKRQREIKVREKAQLKRERREQRRNEKKALLAPLPLDSTLPAGVTGANPEAETLASVDNELPG